VEMLEGSQWTVPRRGAQSRYLSGTAGNGFPKKSSGLMVVGFALALRGLGSGHPLVDSGEPGPDGRLRIIDRTL
jgi:hypothetical protein